MPIDSNLKIGHTTREALQDAGRTHAGAPRRDRSVIEDARRAGIGEQVQGAERYLSGDDVVPTFATLTTALTGTNNDLKYTAQEAGVEGNSISVSYVDPPGNNVALSVALSDSNSIVVTLATDGTSTITSTAAQVRDAVAAHAGAADLVAVENATGNDGTGVVTALADTPLAGAVG